MRSIVIFDSRFDRSPVRGLIPYFTLSSHLHTTPHFSDSENRQEGSIDLKGIKGGYTSYNKIYDMGNIFDLTEFEYLTSELSKFLSQLESDKVFTLLCVVRYVEPNTDKMVGATVGKSIKIMNNISLNLFRSRMESVIDQVSTQYSLPSDAQLLFMYREWLTDEEVAHLKAKNINFKKIISDELQRSISENVGSTYEQIKNRVNFSKFEKYLKILPGAYGPLISSEDNIHKLSDNEGLRVERIDNTTTKVTMVGLKNNSPTDFEGLQWRDEKTKSGFKRKLGNLILKLNENNKISDIRYGYSFPSLPEGNIEQNYDNKIGSIDFETYTLDLSGVQVVYAAGWACEGVTNMFYIGDPDCNNEKDLMHNLIKDIFTNLKDGYTFYAHNLGRFDSLFLLRSLGKLDFKLLPKFKDDSLLSLKITDLKTKKSITILDSIYMFNAPLREVCKNFNFETQKGIFPYKFVNEETLFYKGVKPGFEYYTDVDKNDWNLIQNENWDIKAETLKYLESDLKGLLEALLKFSQFIYDNYSINMTKSLTLPSLAMKIFLARFYNIDNNIKIIKGGCEKDIRNAYFAGLNQVFEHEVKHGFMYDMVSQYPAAMKNNPMPVGNPVLTTEKDLEKIFGFSYCQITAPEGYRLRNLILPVRTEKGVIMGKGTFNGWYFSEELKFARDNGYKIEVICSLEFNKGYGIFNSYVDEFFTMKDKAKNPVERSIAKLFLNSLYGRFGMNEIIDHLMIVNKEKAEKITKLYNYSMFSQIDEDRYIVKYSTRLSDSLQKLLKETGMDITEDKAELGLSKKRGVQSAVQISAAITAYGRISINKFTNDPNNKAYMSATDSLVCEKELPESVVGRGLGQMKLERKIAHGIFIRKNVYGLLLEKGNFISKCGGLGQEKLTYSEFQSLFAGKDLIKTREIFKVDWQNLNVKILEVPFTIKGLRPSSPESLDSAPSPTGSLAKGPSQGVSGPQAPCAARGDFRGQTDPRFAPMTMFTGPIKPAHHQGGGAKQDVDNLVQELVELTKKIEFQKNELKSAPDSFSRQLTEALLMEYSHKEYEVLKKLRNLGVKDPYKLLSERCYTLEKDPALAPMTILIKPEKIKLLAPAELLALPEPAKLLALPAPAKLLALRAPSGAPFSDFASRAKSDGVGEKTPEIIYMPARLPEATPLPAPPKALSLVIESPALSSDENLGIYEWVLKIKEINDKIDKLNSEIKYLNIEISGSRLAGEFVDKQCTTSESHEKEIIKKIFKIGINVPQPSVDGGPKIKNEVEQLKYLPAPAKLLALPAPSGAVVTFSGDSGTKESRAGKNTPEIINSPAPLPDIIYLSGFKATELLNNTQIPEQCKTDSLERTNFSWSTEIENWLIETKKEIEQINNKKLILIMIKELFKQKIEMDQVINSLTVKEQLKIAVKYIKILVKLYLAIIMGWTRSSELEKNIKKLNIISEEGWIEELRMFQMTIRDEKWFLYDLKTENDSSYKIEKAVLEPAIYLIAECIYQILYNKLVSIDELLPRMKENREFWEDCFLGMDEKNKILNPRLIEILETYGLKASSVKAKAQRKNSLFSLKSPKRAFSTCTNKSQVQKQEARIREIIESIKDTENFKIAFTHKLCRNEDIFLKSYETLEFYGDDLINHYVTEFLCYSFPDYSEGQLTNLRSSMVSGENLASLSKKIGLESYLHMDKGVKISSKILVDIFESLTAALYLEKGEEVLHEFLSLTLFEGAEIKDKLKEYKLRTQKAYSTQSDLIKSTAPLIKKSKEKKITLKFEDNLIELAQVESILEKILESQRTNNNLLNELLKQQSQFYELEKDLIEVFKDQNVKSSDLKEQNENLNNIQNSLQNIQKTLNNLSDFTTTKKRNFLFLVVEKGGEKLYEFLSLIVFQLHVTENKLKKLFSRIFIERPPKLKSNFFDKNNWQIKNEIKETPKNRLIKDQTYETPKNSLTFIDYTNKEFLLPLIKIQDNSLMRIEYSENILNQIKDLQKVLYKLPDSNQVKLWLKKELQQDKIIINAKKNEGIEELLKKIFNIIDASKFFLSNKKEIRRDPSDYYEIKNSLFVFNNTVMELNKKFNINQKNPLFACCYIITFKNRYYYYIGCTTKFKNRFNSHSKNINNKIYGEDYSLNRFFEYFLDSEINYLNSKKMGKNALEFKINILCLSTNYLNKFIKTFPSYELTQEELILLDFTTDFLIKTLEENLIKNFQPKLNMLKKINFKY